MNHYLWIALLILISVVVGLIRIIKGPTAADRMLAAQLFGTGGVAILLILAQAMQMPSLVDVALTYALLAAVTMVVFVRRHWGNYENTGKGKDESH
ncbi:MAG: monovalent cation/H+ antiporter complex subunit F [Desulfobacterales bacterium]|jgi:multicomponent Na+:H+ antiporter subunit F